MQLQVLEREDVQLDGMQIDGTPVLDARLGPADGAVEPGPPVFAARHLVVRVKHRGVEKTLLDDVSFGLAERSLTAVIGPSGSGKSTLLRALTGYRPADEGEVLYEERDLYHRFAELRHRIGLVPQDDILHPQLTVRSALTYAATLRFPDGTSEADRGRRVEEVLDGLHLGKYADNKISTLSGGQRKRVSVALELLTKPSLMFLDEPTSGLDPGMDREVMKLLRCLADEGQTVLVVTHSVAELAVCDRLLVMGPGGVVAYFGPPDEALAYFECDTWADVFHGFTHRHDHDWGGQFRGSAQHRKYCAPAESLAVAPEPAALETAVPEPAALEAAMLETTTLQAAVPEPAALEAAMLEPTVPGRRSAPEKVAGSTERLAAAAPEPRPARSSRPQPPPKPQSWSLQLRTLIRRYLAVIAADRGYIGLLIALPLIMGALSMAIPAKFGLAPATGTGLDGAPLTNTDASTVLLVLAVGACLTGAANAVRELIKERVIYERERAAGLSRSAYLMSKVIVLGVITSLQTLVLSAICLLPRKLPDSGLVISGTPIPEMMFAVMLLGVTSMMLGLLVSAIVKTTEKTMPLLVLIAIVQVVFCGSLFPLFGKLALAQLSWLSPSRWAVAAEAATVNLPKIMGPPPGRHTTDALWQHTLTQWATDIGALVLLGLLCGALVIRALRRHEPAVMRCG